VPDIGFLLFCSSLLVFAGFGGLLFTRHLIHALICLEIILLSSLFNFIIFDMYYGSVLGNYALLVFLGLGAGEVGLGLAIFYRSFKVANPDLSKEESIHE